MALSWNCMLIKYLLFGFNLAFFIIGIIFVSVGAAVKGYFSEYETFIDSPYLSASHLLIAIGVIIFIISFFGCCGAFKESYCMIISFSALLILIFVLEFAAGITGYVLRRGAHDYIQDQMQRKIADYRPNSTEPITVTWDAIQTTFKCCGAERASDWTNNTSTNGMLPFSCCKPKVGTLGSFNCTVEFAYQEGCVNSFAVYLVDHSATIGGIGLGFAAVQILGILFACYLSSQFKKKYIGM